MPKKSNKNDISPLNQLTPYVDIPDELVELSELNDSRKIKAVVMKKLGFTPADIASRLGIDEKTLQALLKTFHPPHSIIQIAAKQIISGLAEEMKLGFIDEVSALNDVYYIALNKLKLKVEFDQNLSVADLKSIVEMAHKIKVGNPFDDQVNLFFQQVNNKQEIIDMANGEPEYKEPEPRAEESSGSEAH